jgi:glutamine amidotransferase
MGNPVLMHDLLYLPEHSIVTQSLSSTMGAEPTNGDGFGIGWYGIGDEPAQFRSVEPAWHDKNLQDISKHIMSKTIFCHVRAASAKNSVQQTNCHPFRYGQWLFQHNGVIRSFAKVKRELILEVDAEIFPDMLGSTDSEVFFFLALTYGLEDDPPKAIAKAIAFVEHIGRNHNVQFPFQGTVALSNGEQLWAFRYSSENKSRTLFYSTDTDKIKAMYPEGKLVAKLSKESRLVVSEPLSSLPGVWNEVAESSYLVVKGETIHLFPFQPSDDFA